MEIHAKLTFVVNEDVMKDTEIAKDFIDELIYNTYKSNMHVFDEMDMEWINGTI